jgi:hypothetical protein
MDKPALACENDAMGNKLVPRKISATKKKNKYSNDNYGIGVRLWWLNRKPFKLNLYRNDEINIFSTNEFLFVPLRIVH